LSSQLNHYQEGDGLSYCFATLLLEFTPSYWTLLLIQYEEPQSFSMLTQGLVR